MVGDAEPRPQRRAQQGRASRRAHDGEARQRQPDRTRARALAQDDVQDEILHGRIEDLLDRPAEAVDLVDEQDVTRLKVGQDGGQVSGAFDRRPGCDLEVDLHFVGE
jgi:hypothetical protein